MSCFSKVTWSTADLPCRKPACSLAKLHPRESDPYVVQVLGGVTASPTLLGPVLVWHWCRRRGCKWTPKVWIWWKSGQNSLKSRKNLWIPSRTPWKSKQKANMLGFEKMASKCHGEVFFGGHFFRDFFGQVCENSGKNPSHFQKFPCSCICVVWNQQNYLKLLLTVRYSKFSYGRCPATLTRGKAGVKMNE